MARSSCGRFLALALLASVLGLGGAQTCIPRKRQGSGSTLGRLFVGEDAAEGRPLGAYECDYLVVPKANIEQTDACNTNGSAYLLFEFWRLENRDQVDPRLLENVYFLVARGAQPNVTYANSDVLYNPPKAASPQLGQNGTLQDDDADRYWRPYHRVLVPVNATTSVPNSGDWYVTVANLDPKELVNQYLLRLSCVSAEQAPCAQPLPGAGSCSGRGECVDPPEAVVKREPLTWQLNRVCACQDGWGDYGCQVRAPTLLPGQVQSRVIPSGGWAFWQIRVPLPVGGSSALTTLTKPSLLVELTRESGPAIATTVVGADGELTAINGYGGDPVLVVMPKDSDASNRLPWFTDITRYADLRSYFLQQDFHYLMLRDLTAGPATGAVRAQSAPYAEYYVAVYNNDQRFTRDPQLLFPAANVTVKARWRTSPSSGSSTGSAAVGGDPPGPLCPGDCFNHGVCYDPWDLANAGSLPPTLLPPVTATAAKPEDFQCACRGDWGGTMCEGALRNVTVSTSGQTYTELGRQPGGWTFYLLQFNRFDYRNDLAIQWSVKDAQAPGGPAPTDPPTSYANAFLTIDEHAFPRDAQQDSTDPFRRGWQIFYSSLAQRSNPPQPLQIKGSDLKPGYMYVLGVYNSDYVRQTAFDSTLAIYVPSTQRTWLHPYMSVVLGVTASIILCLLMTLCRRLIQRYGWGPLGRSRGRMEGTDVNGQRVQVAHIPPRPHGVPAGVVASFHTYTYGASKKEREHLFQNRRDHEAVQQLEQAVAGVPAAEPPGFVAANGGGMPATTAAAAATAPNPVDGVVVVGFPPATAGVAAAGVAPPLPGAVAPAAVAADADDDEPQCTVCLCEYEEGERITQLPCKHDFHSTCINKWLQTHSTCPICRVSLLPEPTPEELAAAANAAAAAAAGGGDAGDQAAAAVAAAAAAARGRPQRQSSGRSGSRPGSARRQGSARAALAAAAAAAAAQTAPMAGGAQPMPPVQSAAAEAAATTANDNATANGNGNALVASPTAGGMVSRMLGSFTRRAPPTQAAAAAAPPPPSSTQLTVITAAEPEPAALQTTPSGSAAGGGGGRSVLVVSPPAGGAAQLVARGPTATLDRPGSGTVPASGASVASSLSPGSRHTGGSARAALSPSRLASTRTAGSPQGSSAGGPTSGRSGPAVAPSPAALPLRDAAALSDIEQPADGLEHPDVPGLSAPNRR
ncbi:hypothetical protein HYH03_007193 [Edaphochlamys debaryana]|uniref:RING-type E3 ubiquitin transferase n=1 Tax=Edaphochlamys debaryana TaxID=47281 RepID=A0A835Y3T6_9CHLO|nr:hypothetical protein HYH03_007193 [Edaphochlamys debaryana]|eukprot:KAG2494677.1 hypothetical protein HYH03_007193 [Edaphochlamys debaryana]